MPGNLAACVYALLAITAAFVLASCCFADRRPEIRKIYISWMVITGLIFLVPIPFIYFSLTGIVLYRMAPKEPEGLIRYYCAMMPVVPMFVLWSIPFPGLQQLFMLDHMVLLNMVLLLPLWLKHKGLEAKASGRPQSVTRLAGFALLYFVVVGLLELREESFTNGLRTVVVEFLSSMLILLAFVKVCRSRELIDAALMGVLVSGSFVACIAVIQQLTTWKFYSEVPDALVPWKNMWMFIRDFRGGLMRTPGTMAPIPFGFFMATCIGILRYYSWTGRYQGKWKNILLGLFIVGLVFSGSRGAMLGGAVIVAVQLAFSKKIASLRPLLIVGVIAAVLFSGFTDSLFEKDEYGTFDYRSQLFYNSMVVIEDNPLLGDLDFLEHPAMERSRQGQDLIDIVNAYLGIALRHGLVGLSLFVIPMLILVLRLLSLRRRAEKHNLPDMEGQVRLVLSVLLGTIAFIVTVSFVDRIQHYYWLFFALGVGLIVACSASGMDRQKR